MAEPTSNLTEAVASIQAELPKVAKDNKAEVPTKAGGKYSYTYADLADVSAIILPMLGKVGLAWITKPMLADDGSMVLHYKLRHVSGEVEEGDYPLPDPRRSTPQEVGSAITYARRYCLCSVTGVAPADDDDDAAAASTVKPAQDRAEGRPARRDETAPKDDTPKPPKMPTSPIGWTNLIARLGIPFTDLTDAFAHDEDITAALTSERWSMAVRGLPGDKQTEIFQYLTEPDEPTPDGD